MTNSAAGPQKANTESRHIIGVIGDQDTVTGMLLAGVGQVDSQQRRNYFIVDSKTSDEAVAASFQYLTGRPDIAVLLINQHIANRIRGLVEDYDGLLPTLLEIPSKEHPWDPEQDTILRKVNKMYSSE